jgi:CheY-like chemotaxis protein
VQVEQVVLNLAVNARDAMPSGGTLTFETSNLSLDDSFTSVHRDARPGRFVRLRVRDSGVGMDAETRSHVFEPFFTTKAGRGGTGLGLATVYGIVKQLGGHIDVASRVGRGTEFTLLLPRAAASPSPEPAPTTAGAAPGAGERILLVEDAGPLRDLVAKQLASRGYRVLKASNPHEALALAATEAIEGLVADISLPGMSGAELALRLRERSPQLRVLLVSGYSEALAVPPEAAEFAFLQKPFSAAALHERLRALFDRV